MSRCATAVLALVLALGLLLPATATAGQRNDGDDVRVSGRCTRASKATLRVRADDGKLRIELRIDVRRRGTWSVIVLHERRIAFRGTLRPTSSSGSVRLRRTVPDWFGRDTVVVRATGPLRETCRAAATA